MEATSLIRERAAPARSTARVAGAAWSIPRLAILASVLALTLLAVVIRLSLIDQPDGRLENDEARLALSADGVLRSGLPILPSGRIYTRGLLNSYLVAPSFALFGRHDFAARIPSVLAGALLVPVVFLLGQAFGGTVVGLASAAFTALAEPLVGWSGSAWVPSVFLLLFTLGVYCGYRGFVDRRPGWQVAWAACFCLTLMSYEFAVLLPAALVLFLGTLTLLGQRDWYRGRPTALALGLVAFGLGLFAALTFALRAGTLAGGLSEATAYFSPSASLKGLVFYLTDVLGDYQVLVAITLLALVPLARRRPRPAAYLVSLMGLAVLVPALVVQNKLQTRYILPAVPLLAILATASAIELANLAARWLHLKRFQAEASSQIGNNRWALLAVGLVLGIALVRDIGGLTQSEQPKPGPSWLEIVRQQDIQPTDLLMTDAPLVAQFYLGQADFYVQHSAFERYAYPASDRLRYIYTDATLLHRRGDFERLVERPNPGRTVWLLGREDRVLGLPNLMDRMDRNLWPSLVRSADRLVHTPDGWVLLELTLPRRANRG